MDTGATYYIFANRALFTELRECRAIMTTVSGHNYPCMAMGSVPLDIGNNNIITLKDVLQVPDFDINLLSTVLLARNNVSVILNKLGKPSQFIYNDETIGYADLVENKYVVRGTPLAEYHTFTISRGSPELQYRRMGHLGYLNLIKL